MFYGTRPQCRVHSPLPLESFLSANTQIAAFRHHKVEVPDSVSREVVIFKVIDLHRGFMLCWINTTLGQEVDWVDE
jgi:hypothetical protein